MDDKELRKFAINHCTKYVHDKEIGKDRPATTEEMLASAELIYKFTNK